MRMTTAMFKRSATTVGMMSLLWILSTLIIPSSSHAAIFFDTSFETCTTETGNDFPCEGWVDGGFETVGIPPNIHVGLAVVMSPAAAFSGSKGVRGIHDMKTGTVAGNGGNTQKPSIYKSIPAGTKHTFARWAFREASGFEFCAINGSTKLVRFNGNGYPKIWLLNYGGSYVIAAEGPYDSAGASDLFYSGVQVSTSAWQQIEFEWKLNTPGQPDGLMRLWVDGVLRIERLNRQWVGPTPTSTGLHHNNVTPSTLTTDSIQLYMQCGLGTMYYDRIAVGNTRIGPTNSKATSVDSTAPASPQELQVR